ncbi:hypothetical protein LWI28_004384 [Acer negundo]|uniref:Wax synthase domain-containing protein n=1 Tax=Acer negundo TaxID=4023 RepID=A0AAD5IT72_ACENE|nr:hypothetical protein LWI28_004384 [Acer negundo]
MDAELRNLTMIWFIVLLSLSYCYAIGKKIPKGVKRLLYVLPIIVIFLYLPLNLYSFYINSLVFFSITWLGNSKLLLFAFGKGPLSSNPSMSLVVFLAVASLPIKLQQNGRNKQQPYPENPKNNSSSILINAIKVSLMAIIIYITKNYGVYIHPEILLHFMNCLQFYLPLEMIPTLISALVGSLLGLELEPNFKDPFLSTSLQDFWGRRWNLAASDILRLTVYGPTKKMFTYVFGDRWATSPAVVTTFLVSGFIHDLMFYYMVRRGEMTVCYFLLHGMCVAVEIEIKKTFKKWRFPRMISMSLTLGFMSITSTWFWFPIIKRLVGTG